jgi:hypothetical protein
VESPVPQLKVFLHINVPFQLSQVITMMLNFLHLGYSSVECPNPMISKETLNGVFIVITLIPENVTEVQRTEMHMQHMHTQI